MIRILKESFKNLPSWLKPYMNKGITSTLNDHDIDLYNAEYQDASDITPRDPRWKTGGILTMLLPNGSGKPDLYMWGYDHPESNPYVGNGKYASDMPRSWLINNAIKIGFIKKNNKPYRTDRYRDPRKIYHGYADHKGEYGGQYYYDNTKRYKYDPETMPPGEWHTNRGRDKSGYVIPDPAKLVGKMYEFDLNNSAKVLDNYYKKIIRIKNQLFGLEFRGKDSDWRLGYSSLMRNFGDITRYFVDLEKEVNELLQDSQSKDWDAFFAKYPNMTKDEWFKNRLSRLPDKKNLDDYLYDIQADLKKFNS